MLNVSRASQFYGPFKHGPSLWQLTHIQINFYVFCFLCGLLAEWGVLRRLITVDRTLNNIKMKKKTPQNAATIFHFNVLPSSPSQTFIFKHFPCFFSFLLNGILFFKQCKKYHWNPRILLLFPSQNLSQDFGARVWFDPNG